MRSKAINVGVIGLGTIGTGVVKILQKDADILKARSDTEIILKAVADIDPKEKAGIDYDKFRLTRDASQIIDDPEIDIVVEVIGGVTHAKTFIEAALGAKKHVVTANKELMAKHGRALIALAKAQGVDLFYEASSGGGIPIINALTSALAANRFQRFYGILNGTTNYILTKMHQEGAEFGDVLKEAQELGYAEADPTSDVDGHDVAYKLTILGSIAFDCTLNIDDVYREGIRGISFRDIEIAKQYGYVIKLLAIGILRDADRVELRVHPVMLESSHPLAAVNESFNAVYVEGENVGETMFYGRGAGELPTASAIVGDIVSISRAIDADGSTPCLNFGGTEKRVIPMGDIESKYFLRLIVKDTPGVFAAISRIFADQGVSITSAQQFTSRGVDAEIVIITHHVKESRIQEAMRQISDLEVVRKVSSLIRAEL